MSLVEIYLLLPLYLGIKDCLCTVSAEFNDYFVSGGFESPYWILDTDYISYSVVFTCQDFGLFNYRKIFN
jgi:hypothetical protein